MSNFWIKHTITARISASARFFPAQLACPALNGMNASCEVSTGTDPVFSEGKPDLMSHRSGQKVSGAGEKYFGSRWITYGEIFTAVPSGSQLPSMYIEHEFQTRPIQDTYCSPINFPPVPFSGERWSAVVKTGCKRIVSFLSIL